MKDASTKRMPVTLDEQRAYIKALPDDEIDCSDIPEITDFSAFVRTSDYPSRREALEASRALKRARRQAAE